MIISKYGMPLEWEPKEVRMSHGPAYGKPLVKSLLISGDSSNWIWVQEKLLLFV